MHPPNAWYSIPKRTNQYMIFVPGWDRDEGCCLSSPEFHTGSGKLERGREPGGRSIVEQEATRHFVALLKERAAVNLWCAACMRGIAHESYYPVDELANRRISCACPSSLTVGSSQTREEKIAHDKPPSSRHSKWINGCGLPTVFASSVSAPLLGSCGRTPCRWWETCSMPCISRGEGGDRFAALC